MEDPEIAALVAALSDPATLATRKNRMVSILAEHELSGKAPDLEHARYVYFSATMKDNSSSIVPNSQEARRFIRDMHNEVAMKQNLDVVIDWFRELRLRYLGIGTDSAAVATNALKSLILIYPPATQSWGLVADEVANFMAVVKNRIRLFLSREHLVPIWDPPAAWKTARIGDAVVDLTDHLSSLRLPSLSLSGDDIPTPVLLLYMLGNYGDVDGQRMDHHVDELVGGSSNVTLVNTSGSGKTRQLLEVLCRQLGFYFTCVVDRAAPPHGSRDMSDFPANAHFIQSRRTPGGAAFTQKVRSSDELLANVTIVQQIVDVVFLARLMVFDIFLDLCTELSPGWSFQPVQDRSQRVNRAWALLQAFPCLNDAGELAGTDDIFRELVDRLKDVSNADIATRREALLARVRNEHKAVPQYYVFDEVQTVAMELKEAFPVLDQLDPGLEKGRPLLKPIVMSIHRHLPTARIFVAGTHLFKADVQLALMSNAFKSLSNVVYSDLGGYFADEDAISVLCHFFTPAFVDAWDANFRDEVLFWFCGRHRFLTYFIQRVLCHGPDEKSMREVMANIRYVAAGSPLPADVRNLNLRIPSLIPLMFPLRGAEGRPNVSSWDESADVRAARHASLLYLTTGIYPSYEEPEKRKLVELGIARFVDTSMGGVVKITERLVHAALVNYFNDPRNPANLRTATDEMLKMKVGISAVGGYGLELSMVHLFMDLFGAPEGVRLSDVFNFDATIHPPGPTRGRSYTPLPVPLDYTPHWASYRARLLGNFAIKRQGGPRIVHRGALATPVAQLAKTSEDSLSWFRNMCRDDGQAWPPFLLPDRSLGPDGVCGLELTDPMNPAVKLYLLALISCKNWSTPNGKGGTLRARGGEEVRSAMFTMSPEGLFSTIQNGDARLRAQTELRQYLSVFEPLPGVKQPKSPEDVQAQVKASVTAAREAINKRPLAPPKKKADEIVYKYDDAIRFGAIRCLASYPNTVKLPYITTAEGLYPFATLTENVMEHASAMGFQTYTEALIRVHSHPRRVDETSAHRDEESIGPVTIVAEDDPSQPDLDSDKYDGAAILQDYSAVPATVSAAYLDGGPDDGDGDYASLFGASDDDGGTSSGDEMSLDEVEDGEPMHVDSERGTPTGRKRQASPSASSSTRAGKRRAVGT